MLLSSQQDPLCYRLEIRHALLAPMSHSPIKYLDRPGGRQVPIVTASNRISYISALRASMRVRSAMSLARNSTCRHEAHACNSSPLQVCESYNLGFDDVKQKLENTKQEFMQEPLQKDTVYNQSRAHAALQRGRDLKRSRPKNKDSPCSSGSGCKQASPTAAGDVVQSARERNKNKRQARALERVDSGCVCIPLQLCPISQA